MAIVSVKSVWAKSNEYWALIYISLLYFPVNETDGQGSKTWLLLCFVSIVFAQLPVEVCPQNGYRYPMSEDCKGFYKCAPQGLVPAQCETGKYFNCANKQCEATADRTCCPQDVNAAKYPQSRLNMIDRMRLFFR